MARKTKAQQNFTGSTDDDREAMLDWNRKVEAEKRVTGALFLRAIINDKVKRATLAQKLDAAKALLPHELPRLNSVDHVQRTVTMTHEQWIEEIDRERAAQDNG